MVLRRVLCARIRLASVVSEERPSSILHISFTYGPHSCPPSSCFVNNSTAVHQTSPLRDIFAVHGHKRSCNFHVSPDHSSPVQWPRYLSHANSLMMLLRSWDDISHCLNEKLFLPQSAVIQMSFPSPGSISWTTYISCRTCAGA